MFKNVLNKLFSTLVAKKKAAVGNTVKILDDVVFDVIPSVAKTVNTVKLSQLQAISTHEENFLTYLFGETSEGLESNSFSDFISEKIEALLLSPKGLMQELPVMPASVITLMTELKKDDFNLDELLQIIEREPGLAADVIKIANSPLYRRSEKTITDLRAAFMNMGAHVLLETIVYSHLKKLTPRVNVYFKCFGEKIWLHCLQTASFSKMLIEDGKNNEEKSTAYLVGLLLNLGKMIIFQIMIEAFRHVHPDEKPNSQAFKVLISMYSMRLTYSIAKFWQLPDTILQALALQSNKPSSDKKLALAVYEANVLSELAYLRYDEIMTEDEFLLQTEQSTLSHKGKALAVKIQQGELTEKPGN